MLDKVNSLMNRATDALNDSTQRILYLQDSQNFLNAIIEERDKRIEYLEQEVKDLLSKRQCNVKNRPESSNI